MAPLFERNKNWEVHICDNQIKDEFMNKTFAGTSFLWAYHVISPAAGAAKADLWRYAVLWTYGGVYIDDDSDIKSPLDKVVEPTDTLVVAYEKNGFNANRCYIPTYHLSDFSAYRNESRKELKIFHHRCLLNWAMISAPRHQIIAATMHNAVEIIRGEFMRDSVLRSLNAAYYWEAIMCSTGPSLLTASAREVIIHNPSVSYRLANVDFKDYGGKFKAVYTPVKNDPNHYMNMKKGKGAQFLSDYLPEAPISAEQLKQWQGRGIQAQNGKEIFVVDGGKKRGIPNYDTFLALNFTMADVIVVADSKLAGVPLGDSMPSLMV